MFVRIIYNISSLEIYKTKEYLPRAKLSLADFGFTFRPLRLFVLYQPLNILDFGLPSVLILSALMRHKLSKRPFAELKFTSISVLLLFYTMVRVLLSIPSVCDFYPLCLDHRGLQLQSPIPHALFGKKNSLSLFFSHFRRKLPKRKKK